MSNVAWLQHTDRQRVGGSRAPMAVQVPLCMAYSAK
jgi:hypothetical protein